MVQSETLCTRYFALYSLAHLVQYCFVFILKNCPDTDFLKLPLTLRMSVAITTICVTHLILLDLYI